VKRLPGNKQLHISTRLLRSDSTQRTCDDGKYDLTVDRGPNLQRPAPHPKGGYENAKQKRHNNDDQFITPVAIPSLGGVGRGRSCLMSPHGPQRETGMIRMTSVFPKCIGSLPSLPWTGRTSCDTDMFHWAMRWFRLRTHHQRDHGQRAVIPVGEIHRGGVFTRGEDQRCLLDRGREDDTVCGTCH
jgi:hypothetical protein